MNNKIHHSLWLASSILIASFVVTTASVKSGKEKKSYDLPAFGTVNQLPETVTVFANKQDGYPRYRIPNLIATSKGTLLAVIEGRQGGDHSKNDIVLKRSNDGGKTWSSLQVVDDQGDKVLIDSNSFIDNSTHRIFICYNMMAWGYHNTKAVPGYDSPHANRHYLVHSDDDGNTWSKPREITKAVKPDHVTHAIIAPGAKGVCLESGPHKGRLVFPVNRNEPVEGKGKNRCVYTVYSDDHGNTWQRGAIAQIDDNSDPKGDASEPHITQLRGGILLINTRSPNKKVDQRFRRQAYSKDGGKTWSKLSYTKDLLDPGCCASLLTVKHNGKETLLFINPYTKKGRANGTVSVSTDGGKSWPLHKQLYPAEKGFGYSSSAQLPDGSIGVFFEADGCKAMKFTRFTLDWLMK